MYNYFLPVILAVCWLTTNSFALPVKQKEIIEKLIIEGSFEKALSAIEHIQDEVTDDSDLLLLKGICYYTWKPTKPRHPPSC